MRFVGDSTVRRPVTPGHAGWGCRLEQVEMSVDIRVQMPLAALERRAAEKLASPIRTASQSISDSERVMCSPVF